jgi:hypothetical protein
MTNILPFFTFFKALTGGQDEQHSAILYFFKALIGEQDDQHSAIFYFF